MTKLAFIVGTSYNTYYIKRKSSIIKSDEKDMIIWELHSIEREVLGWKLPLYSK